MGDAEEGPMPLAGATNEGSARAIRPSPNPLPKGEGSSDAEKRSIPPGEGSAGGRPVERRMRRWEEQRWLLDAVIGAAGLDWDQGRSRYLVHPCGLDAEPDFARARQRVRKFADISREFAQAAGRREALAQAALAEGRTVTAREHAFIASVLWGAAQWPIFENTPENIEYDERKVRCYETFMAQAPHPVRRVEIPFGNASLPAYLHLPRESQGRVPCVLTISGMDTFKEIATAMYGDKLLERGIARLCIDGPGQGECCTRGITVTATNHADAGRAAFEWLKGQPEIDPERLGLYGISMGSFWATQVAAAVPGLRGCAVAFVCHEPGMQTLFNTSSPTFKLRFMYMAGYEAEAEFDAFAATLSLEGLAERVTCPYLVIAGEDDELSPIEHTYRLLEQVRAPKQLVVYQGERHSLGGGLASQLGPNRNTLVADWFADRFAGRELRSERVYVDTSGVSHVTAL